MTKWNNTSSNVIEILKENVRAFIAHTHTHTRTNILSTIQKHIYTYAVFIFQMKYSRQAIVILPLKCLLETSVASAELTAEVKVITQVGHTPTDL